MTMTYKITFADLGWYEVKAESRKEAEEVALVLQRYCEAKSENGYKDCIHNLGSHESCGLSNELPYDYIIPDRIVKETEAKLSKVKSNIETDTMSPEEMARYLMGFCRCYLATGNGCPGCPFDKPTSNDGDGECRLGVPSDWDF